MSIFFNFFSILKYSISLQDIPPAFISPFPFTLMMPRSLTA